MNYWINHCGEHSNRCYATIFETDSFFYGPFKTEEEAIKAAEQRGLTTTSLQDIAKK